ncbi:MAG: hypothetical protein QXG86_02510 [Candidatus Woesearchaeota archaeon]
MFSSIDYTIGDGEEKHSDIEKFKTGKIISVYSGIEGKFCALVYKNKLEVFKFYSDEDSVPIKEPSVLPPDFCSDLVVKIKNKQKRGIISIDKNDSFYKFLVENYSR